MSREPLSRQSTPRDMPISEWDHAHTLYVLREAKRGRSVGDINRESRFSYWGSFHVAFVLREQGYISETIVGKRAVEPYVMQGGFQVSDEPIWRGEITEKGEALLSELEASA